MNIPKGTTHVWTPAVEKEVIGMGWHRRAFYKLVDNTWKSYSKVHEAWCKSANDSDWFNKETKEGYFVSIEQFNHPDFVMKPEKV